MPKRFQARKSIADYIAGLGAILLICALASILLAPITFSWSEILLKLVMLLGIIVFTILSISLLEPERSYIEISDKGIGYKSRSFVGKIFVAWQDITLIRTHRYTEFHLFFGKAEVDLGDNKQGTITRLFAYDHYIPNFIPIERFKYDWRKELTPYIEKYDIPVRR